MNEEQTDPRLENLLSFSEKILNALKDRDRAVLDFMVSCNKVISNLELRIQALEKIHSVIEPTNET